MSTPFNGWASSVAIQAETTFNAASAATVYALVGKTRFSQNQQFLGRTSKTDVWRNQTDSATNATAWTGTIEIEVGFNAVVKLLLSSLLELYATSAVGGLTQYSFRPSRLGSVPSLKLGLSYNPGGPYWIYSGVVIDQIGLSILRNQTPKLTAQFRAAGYASAGAADPLGAPTTVSKLGAAAANCSLTLNASALSNLFEANFTISETKALAHYGSDGIATRAAKDGHFTFGGQIGEYFYSASPLVEAVRDQVDRAFFFSMADPSGSARLFSITWPRINLRDGRPDGIAKGDLPYRVNFSGLQDTNINEASQPTIILIA